jgi:hypothetical protein
MTRTRYTAFATVLAVGAASIVTNLGACIGDPPQVTVQEAGTQDAGTQDAGGGCVAPSKLCGAVCTNLQTDNANCGACGNACGPGLACAGGACGIQCPSGESSCADASAACVNLRADPSNCGACGNACGPGLLCSAGTCALECTPGLIACSETVAYDGGVGSIDAGVPDCDGAILNLSCAQASCVATDASPPVIDAGPTLCVNPLLDDNNCGGCGVACSAAQHCLDGSCVDPSSCINDGGTCTYATSCTSLVSAHPELPDAVYTIDVDGTGPLPPFAVYCVGMSTGTPKDYLSLPHNYETGYPHSNYTYVYNPTDCQTGSPTVCASFYRWWTNLHLLFVQGDGGEPSILIDPTDLTFAILSDPSSATATCWQSSAGACGTFYATPYGTANNCDNGYNGSSVDVDLGGTPFSIDPSMLFVLGGYNTRGNVTMNADCTKVDGIVGGSCGSISTCPVDGGQCPPILLDLH